MLGDEAASDDDLVDDIDVHVTTGKNLTNEKVDKVEEKSDAGCITSFSNTRIQNHPGEKLEPIAETVEEKARNESALETSSKPDDGAVSNIAGHVQNCVNVKLKDDGVDQDDNDEIIAPYCVDEQLGMELYNCLEEWIGVNVDEIDGDGKIIGGKSSLLFDGILKSFSHIFVYNKEKDLFMFRSQFVIQDVEETIRRINVMFIDPKYQQLQLQLHQQVNVDADIDINIPNKENKEIKEIKQNQEHKMGEIIQQDNTKQTEKEKEKCDNDNEGQVKNVYHNYIVPCFAFMDNERVKCIEKIFNYKFNRNDLVIAATTHSAFNVSIKSDCSYQRIEFLGDAAIGCLVSQYLFETFVDFDEGRLSHTRAAIVCNHYLSRRIVRRFDKYDYNICKYITIQSHKVRNEFLQYINSFDKEIDDVEFCMQLLITPKEKQPFCPKILADVLEAIFGAILIDCGNNMQILWDIIKPDFVLNEKQIRHIRTRLQSFKVLHDQMQLLLQQAKDEQLEEQKKKQKNKK